MKVKLELMCSYRHKKVSTLALYFYIFVSFPRENHLEKDRWLSEHSNAWRSTGQENISWSQSHKPDRRKKHSAGQEHDLLLTDNKFKPGKSMQNNHFPIESLCMYWSCKRSHYYRTTRASSAESQARESHIRSEDAPVGQGASGQKGASSAWWTSM